MEEVLVVLADTRLEKKISSSECNENEYSFGHAGFGFLWVIRMWTFNKHTHIYIWVWGLVTGPRVEK